MKSILYKNQNKRGTSIREVIFLNSKADIIHVKVLSPLHITIDHLFTK
jgi:hypothetical protein